jgi:predicted Zn-dependent protease
MRAVRVIIPVLVLGMTLAHADDKKNKKDDPSQIGNRDVGKGINFYSPEKELALGKQLADEVARQAKLVDDPLITEYINRMGQNLARNSDAKFPFTFRVIDDEVPNAFALPGGFVFVNTGLIKLASEEDELAGAVAHEIAHVAARHMTRQATKQTIAQMGTIPLSVLLGGGLGGYGARQAAGAAMPMMFLKFSRGDESEADYLGVQYMYAAGYDPNGAVTIFEKMESLKKKQPGVFDRVFSTHPMDADRIDKTQKEIDRILPAKDEYLVNTSEYRDMRERLITMQNRRKVDEKGRPTLRVRPGSGNPEDQKDSDERPTIRRRELVD